jgi:hypothetical protein
VIEYAGSLDHMNEINVWEGDRLVVLFTPRENFTGSLKPKHD